MQARAFRITEDSLQDRFQRSRAKIQVYGGGYANGKTANAVIKALFLARDYPGSNGLIARSTYPKLNDTIRKEFFKWCPKVWIESFSKKDNVAVLKNGTTISFRYIAQQGVNEEQTTSNLLSANYDWIIVDQIEDPEIIEKDFLDLLGRLRGDAPYAANDNTMPSSGPRWLIITCNPTGNWVYRKIVRPLQVFQETGRKLPDLYVDTAGNPIVELYEGSTYANQDNIPADYLATLEATFTGQMRDRFLMGKWGSFEGLVYPQFDLTTHLVPASQMKKLFDDLRTGHILTIVEGYDHGLAKPSCYILGFVDPWRNLHLVTGFYAAEQNPDTTAARIRRARDLYHVESDAEIWADPALFKRSPGQRQLVGRSVATMFLEDYQIRMKRGNADITNGIVKTSAFLNIQQFRRNPYTGTFGSPSLFVSDELQFFVDEITEYIWKKDSSGQTDDKPRDGRDHAMNTWKYMLSEMPTPSLPSNPRIKLLDKESPVMQWRELEAQQVDKRNIRYG